MTRSVYIADLRVGWWAQGQLVNTLDANVPLSPLEVAVYFGDDLDEDRRAAVSLPNPFPRVVLQKPNGQLVICPVTPTTVVRKAVS